MRISVLSLHTSPAAQPGQGDAGGMNVYVDHTVRALAADGHEVDVFTADPHGIGTTGAEADSAETAGTESADTTAFGAASADTASADTGDARPATTTVRLGERIRLHHLRVAATTKDELAAAIDELADLLGDHSAFAAADLIWAHYWISAEAALRALDRGGRLGADHLGADHRSTDHLTSDHLSGDHLGADHLTTDHLGAGAQRNRPTVIASMHTIGAVKNRDSETSEESPRRLRAEERIAAGVDLLVANTPAERRDLISVLGADPDSVIVARPGVDHDLFSPGSRTAARAELGLSDEERLVLYVGRMQFIKGTDVVVDALACLQENNPDLGARTRGILLGAASGWVDPAEAAPDSSADDSSQVGARRDTADPAPAGRAPLSTQHHDSAADYHSALSAAIAADANIEVRPPVPAVELVTYYRAADVLLVPSRSESFGLVAAEAAASGLPAIAAGVGGLPEIVENGYSGLLIADHNPRHWALTLERLLGDEELRAEFAAHAAARSQRFDWHTTVTAVLDALTDECRPRVGAGHVASGAGAAGTWSGTVGITGQRPSSEADLAAPGLCGGWR